MLTLPREGEDLTFCCLVTGVELGSSHVVGSSMFFVVYHLLRSDRRFGPVDFRELQRCLRLDGFGALLHTELKHVHEEKRENKNDELQGNNMIGQNFLKL